MDMPEKMQLTSMKVTEEKRQQLVSLFPEIATESGIDFDKLKRLLGEWVDPGKERFGLGWPGKAECTRVIQEISTATLRPNPNSSIDFDNSENIIIEGDNLETLKLLQRSYYGKVKLIYIDPPYNTGNDFIYPDNYSENIDTYLRYTGQVAEDGKRFSTNTEQSGRFHSRWLNMMYPRLFLAKNLLQEDGFLVISIDDAEYANLKLVCDEIFGQENYLSTLVWDKNRKNDARYFSVGHEYMLVYANSARHLQEQGIILREPKDGIEEARDFYKKLVSSYGNDYDAIQEEWRAFFNAIPASDHRKKLGRFSKIGPKGPYRDDGDISWPGGGGPRYEILHPITKMPCKIPDGGWRHPSPERFWEEVTAGRIVFGDNHNTLPRQCRFLFESDQQLMPSVFYSYAQTATMEFVDLVGSKTFDNPKNWNDIKRLVRYLTGPDDIVMDFFAGSGTTAHAVLQLNAEENSRRKFMLIQLPEACSEKSVAYKMGLHNIGEVCTHRVQKAIESIRSNTDPLIVSQLDMGFRHFKLAASNFKNWDGSVSAELEAQLDLHIEHIAENADHISILYELLIKAGFPLTASIDSMTVGEATAFSVAGGVLLICLENEITPELIDALADREPFQVICLDRAFKGNDQLKANAVQTFKARAASQESEIVFKTV